MASPDPTSGVPGMHLRGWMEPAAVEWLAAQAARSDSVVEVGSLFGRTSYALLTACPGLVYCVDPWEENDGYPYEVAPFEEFVLACGHFPNLRIVRGYSPAAAEQVPDVDMVFIDGAHDYEAVRADIAAWLPKARRLICGHDYHAGFPGVPQAVNEAFPSKTIHRAPNWIWAVWV